MQPVWEGTEAVSPWVPVVTVEAEVIAARGLAITVMDLVDETEVPAALVTTHFRVVVPGAPEVNTMPGVVEAVCREPAERVQR